MYIYTCTRDGYDIPYTSGAIALILTYFQFNCLLANISLYIEIIFQFLTEYIEIICLV